MTTELTLTGEQEAIVSHPAEPLRVAAGAGTGKTTTMVARLAAAVDAGIEPEEALGITFTNKAAEELADRLRAALHGYAVEGREVEVTTYHGFAHRLLHEFGGFAGLDSGLQVIGPGYVRQLIHEAVAAGDYRHLDLTKLAVHVDEAATLGAQLAGNLLQPEQLVAAAPDDPDDAVWSSRVELARALASYRDRKRRLGVVDYGDLIAMAHDLVTSSPEVARRVRSRYRMVVLDEYQDTDPAQRQLLLAIFGGGFPITAVGDEDQTIYEWRGASLENFRGFPRHFPTTAGPAPTLPLSLNRRSGPHILGLADAIRTELHGAPPHHPLRPADGASDQVVCAWFRTSHDEAAWIAGELRRLHDEEGVPWTGMAVVFRKNRHMAAIRDALHDAEIPFEVASLGGLLGVPEVADVHAWLRILHDPADSVALARIVLGSRYRLGLGDLAPLARHARAARFAAGDDPLGFPLLEAVDRLPDVAGLSETAQRRLTEFRELYRRLLVDAQATTLVELIQRIVDGIDGWAEIEAMPEVAGLSARLNLYRFLDLAEDWSPLVGRPSLDGFLSYLDALVAESAGDELSTARVSQGEAVTLVTVHRAKGLEWDTVVLPALTEGTFPSTSQGYDDPSRSPRWLPRQLRLDAATTPPLPTVGNDRAAVLRERHLAQERRTAYVAVTRARTRLLLTGAHWYDGKKPRLPSEIMATARDLPGTEVAVWVEEPGDRPIDLPVPAEAPDPHFPDGWRAALRRALADPSEAVAPHIGSGQIASAVAELQLVLDAMPEPLPTAPPEAAPVTSVTGLMTLAGCPQRFYWSEVDRLPRRPSASMARGSEVHRRIQLHHLGVMSLHSEPSERRDGDIGTGTGTGGTLPPGGDPYQAFLDSRFSAERPILVETPIDIDVAGVRVRGRIDAVYSPRPGAWEIVDYKSGRAPEEDSTAAVQLQAYAVAAADGAVAPERPEEITVTFAYLGSGTVEERSVTADDGWLTSARHRLEALAEQAKGPDYPATPSPSCHRCDFLAFCETGSSYVVRST